MACIGSTAATTPLTTTTNDSVIGLGTKTVRYTADSTLTIPAYGAGGLACTLPTGYTSIVSTIGAISTSNRTAQGTLLPAAADTFISRLGICVPTSTFIFDSSNVIQCDASHNIFITNVQTEYTYYYRLYMFALNRLVTTLDGGTLTGWSAIDTTTTARQNAQAGYMCATTVLNTHVNDIITIIDRIATNWRSNSIGSLTTLISTFESGTGSLQDQSTKLVQQRKLLASGDTMLLMKEMEQYSRQKAKYHNNMLMVYSFLNITALGLLFYIYRSG